MRQAFSTSITSPNRKRCNAKSAYIRFTCNLFAVLLLLTSGLYTSAAARAGTETGDSGYSTEKAVEYADSCFKKSGNTYKPNPNPKYGMELCAGYVSQCLAAGGMAMSDEWYWKSKTDSSDSWRVSKKLFTYLKNAGYQVNYSPTASQINTGDVIFYWTNGGWGHVAICVGKTEDGTPMVNAYNDPHYHFTYWTMGYKTCSVAMENKVATPVITEAAAKDGKKITLACDTEDATIYYTTDGKTPTDASQEYTEPFTLKKNATIMAFAVYEDYADSSVSQKEIDVLKTLEDGLYYLNTENTSISLGIQNSSKKENITASLMAKNEQYNRKFSLAYKGSGKYTITLLHSGYALSEAAEIAAGGLKTDSAAEKKETENDSDKQTVLHTVTQKKLKGDSSQQWTIAYSSSKKYTVKNAKSSAYLSVGDTIKSGVAAYTINKAESTGQNWRFDQATTSTLKLSQETAPTTLKKGEAFTIRGTLTSNYKIQSVRIQIINEKDKVVTSALSVPNATSYSLKNLDEKIRFGELKKGKYIYRITAFDSSKEVKTLKNKSFKVK